MFGGIVMTACAAPAQRITTTPPPPPPAREVRTNTTGRPVVGVAFGGGSARGIAHVGVIKWLEEHRIPIDVTAGTSMGGLIGGAFASGMDGAELEEFITTLDWDQLFGASSFAHKNIRRKADARAYPSRLEFGLRGGIVPPAALNNGEYVELLLGRIAAPYYAIDDFDELPTPFRTVAVDVLSAEPVILRRGNLADAMRATMSLPLVFPPMEIDGQVLIDGGTMNNVPADVVKTMGADRVIAVNVGDLSNREDVNYTMFGVAGHTIDAMMRASTRRTIAAADVIVNVPLEKFDSLAWRRAPELIAEGYKAADAMRDQLLPLALSEADFKAWQDSRKARRRTELPAPAFIELDGFAPRDTQRLEAVLSRHVGVPADVSAIEHDIAIVSGLDRYETVTWSLTPRADHTVGLRVRARLKPYAPPFIMLGVNMANTTSTDFRITATARYLAFDKLGSGSELRVDTTIGSDPTLGMELYRPLGSTPLFVAADAGVAKVTFNLIEDDHVIARYRQTIMRGGLHAGVNIGARSDVRVGAFLGRSSASIAVGDPGFPELEGSESGAQLRWRLDTQDSPIVPARGVQAQATLSHIFKGPDIVVAGDPIAFESTLTQLSGSANQFWSKGPNNRLFVYYGLGTSFDTTPLPTQEFSMGVPFRLSAYNEGEISGAHYYAATGGYLRRVGRLPDFMGGPVFAGGWLENGDAFDAWGDAKWRTNASAGVVMDTLFGPFVLSGSWSFDGRWRTYLGLGRTFR
jgi:NTE family protein